MNKEIALLTKVDCSHLSIQKDFEDEFTIGDPSSGEFLQVPQVAVDVIELLNGRNTIEEVCEIANEKYNEDVDVIDFVMTLLEYGLVLSIDGETLKPEIKREAHPLFQKLGSFFFSKALVALYGISCLAVLFLFVIHPPLFPKFKDLFVYELVGISTFNIVVAAWILTIVHEFGHFLAASKEGISSLIRLNLRMIWLVAETDMSGLWAKPRSKRYIPFLAGMMWDVVIILICLAVQLTTKNELLIAYSKLIVFLTLFAFLFQFIIFLRTDLYFVVSNWKNTSALHQNSLMYLQKTFLKKEMPDWEQLPEHEKKNAVWFGFLYGIGGIIAITLFFYFQAPAILYGLTTVYHSITLYGIESFYFWDSVLVLAVFTLQAIIWLFGLRTSMKERKAERRTVEA
ncbi:PqqD family peptide modification chaperone [Neobacillus sp. YIM B06451]|uniref:PqqD family peptide modification chaperone n=1 Tax=Neobacillus sp. YIM B06451 TaxID=3070994 RepID=UPI002930D34B|nr:PqqD family peptide modification chaperone [Neobacillus sp. YIM B06451]